MLETRVAVEVQQTRLARTEQAITQTSEAAAFQATPEPSATQVLSALQFTPAPESPPVVTDAPHPPVVDLERRMKAAKILLFENMSASGYLRYVKEALDEAGYFYLDVGSATGWFKTQLISQVDWDLIIAAAEANRDFGGDFFPIIEDRIENGSAAIIEYWDFDAASQGMASGLLSLCGVDIQMDWYEPDLRVFYWLQPDHPIFHEPNDVPSLRNAAQIWKGDLGDMLEIQASGNPSDADVQLLAGTSPQWQTHHGLLASCLGGRMILQTFRSHEYRYTEMRPLWQNYVYQTLKGRFTDRPSTAPTPAVTFPAPIPDGSATPEAPLPETGAEFACGEAFIASLRAAPRFQKDLFEHHAEGDFLIVELQLVNQTANPIQIWDGDYFVEGRVNNSLVSLEPHKAATGYLYVDSPRRLWQDLIEPQMNWRTRLAFDVDPSGQGWVLVVRPGYEMNEQVCEVRIPLTQ